VNVVPDTNVWIDWLRGGVAPGELEPGGRLDLFLTTIALQELWAGAQTESVSRVLTALGTLARTHGRLLNPPPPAWIVSGQVLAEIAARRRLSAARLRVLRNDALLAATALSYDAVVLTANRKDFDLLSQFLDVRYQAP
jgi:predicted nucleic acid-binding protein